MEPLKIEYLPVGALRPYERNARKHQKEDVQGIVNSIQQFGFDDPIGIWGPDNLIVAGHGRLLAAKLLGMETVPCIRLDHLNDEQRRAYALAHNKTAENSEWDFDILPEELESIVDIDMSQFGFDLSVTDEKKEIVEDEPPELPEESTSKVGQMWMLGRHKLICGDSTDTATIDRLCGNDAADLLLTDPPYNVNVGNCDRPNSQNNNVHILNDSMKSDEFIGFLTKALLNASRHMRKGAGYYIWYAGLHHTEFESAVLNVHDFKIHEQLVWVKSHFVLGRNSDYQWAHEPCLYGWKDGERHYFTNSRKESTVIEDVRLSTLKKEELIELCEKLMGEDMAVSVLRADKPIAAKLHPTVKPQKLLAELLKNSTKPNWNVLDLFGGSGSTLIACEQLGRTCFMAELDTKYCDVIIQRYEKFTGEKAVLLNV